jgi:hypothetical protein
VDALFSASPVGTPGGFPSLQCIRVANATRRNAFGAFSFFSKHVVRFRL